MNLRSTASRMQRIGLVLALAVAAAALPAGTDAQSRGGRPEAQSEAMTRPALRFLTDNDFPPFHFLDEEGVLTGFNVDIAQAICLELSAACDVQARPWDALLPSLARRDGDAVIASHALTPVLLAGNAVSERYFQSPGRFAARRQAVRHEITPEGLDGRRIAVARGTPHEAYLRSFFRDSQIVAFENVELARDALLASKADYLFDDGVSLVFWLAGTLSKACCELVGSAYYEPRFFGDGMVIVMAKGDPQLVAQINQALERVKSGGRYDELLVKYFPMRVF